MLYFQIGIVGGYFVVVVGCIWIGGEVFGQVLESQCGIGEGKYVYYCLFLFGGVVYMVICWNCVDEIELCCQVVVGCLGYVGVDGMGFSFGGIVDDEIEGMVVDVVV